VQLQALSSGTLPKPGLLKSLIFALSPTNVISGDILLFLSLMAENSNAGWGRAQWYNACLACKRPWVLSHRNREGGKKGRKEEKHHIGASVSSPGRCTSLIEWRLRGFHTLSVPHRRTL
jgi:hypothetical protein